MAKGNEIVATQQEKQKGLISYTVAGMEVKLSYQIVRDYLAKGNGQVSDQDIVQFMSICKYNQLNPFLNEAYLIKFGSQPATMVVSKEALMKRAEANEKYEGIQAGVIVIRENQIVELEGTFYLNTDKLVGGWAKVYRSDKKYPFVSKVNFSEYDKGQSNWKEKPSTMIRKVAEVQALREAFPAQLGAMYTAEEQSTIDIQHEEISSKVAHEKSEHANKIELNIEDIVPGTISEEKPINKEPILVKEGGLFSGNAENNTNNKPEF